MKAIIYTEYGGPEFLRLAEVPKPVPLENEVLIKVHAVSVNDWDFALLQPDMFNRLMSGFFKPKRQIIGSDIAGRIEAVGGKVTKFNPGDEVYGDLSGRWGGFAEYVCAPEQALVLKPASMTFEEAAAIPQAAMLATQGLMDKGNLQPGQKLLINGAGGGVGTFGIQIAQSLGVNDITVVDKEAKLALLKSLGATQCIDYTKEDFTKNGQTYGILVALIKRDRWIHYLGNVMTISLLGALALTPMFLLDGVITSNWFYIGYFMMVVGCMFFEHVRRVRILELPGLISASWVLYRFLVLAIIL